MPPSPHLAGAAPERAMPARELAALLPLLTATALLSALGGVMAAKWVDHLVEAAAANTPIPPTVRSLPHGGAHLAPGRDAGFDAQEPGF